MNRVEGVGSAIFAAVFLMIGGVLNIIHELVLYGATSEGAAG
jgi:hypothetical protein